MADTVSKHIDMTTGSLWRNIPLFAFPVAATSILEQLSNLIATVIIGNFSGDQGTLAMAAVGSNVPLTRDRKSTRLNSSHSRRSRMPSSA